MKEDCAIGDEVQGNDGRHVVCMGGKRPGLCLHISVRTLGWKALALANGAVGSLSKY